MPALGDKEDGGADMTEGGAPPGEMARMLEDLRSLSGEVGAAAVLDAGGELRASTLAPGADRERFGAMLAALSGLAGRTARENGGSGFSRVRIGTEEGYVLLVALEGGGTLAATTGPEARVGLVLYDMRNVREALGRMLVPEDGDGGELG